MKEKRKAQERIIFKIIIINYLFIYFKIIYYIYFLIIYYILKFY